MEQYPYYLIIGSEPEINGVFKIARNNGRK